MNGTTSSSHDRTAAVHSDGEVAQLKREVADLRSQLESAVWALSHLGGDAPLDRRAQALVSHALAEAERIRSEARNKVEQVVADAERLRELARQGAHEAAQQARGHVSKEAHRLLVDATQLTAAAQKEAEDMRRRAKPCAIVQQQIEEIGRTAEEIYADATKRRQEVDGMIAQAREQADHILRNARAAAEQRSRELTESAQRRLKTAQEDADRMDRDGVADRQTTDGPARGR